ncbi:MAG: alpha/beta fold hydrolase [Pseudomonadota bacterium]
MTCFVLVHGGWHGGWCWERVVPLLEAAGHEVHAPTLTGLGERSHLVRAVAGPETHVADIVQVLEWRDLRDVMLVGHSYGGMVITGVAAQVPERIAHLVYLDAFVPTESGQGATAFAPPERAAEIRAATVDGMVAPTGFERWAARAEDLAWLRRMCTPHPANCFDRGVVLTGREAEVAHRSYILCDEHNPSPFRQFHDRYADDPAWICHRLPCLHDAMVEMPDALADLLMKAET